MLDYWGIALQCSRKVPHFCGITRINGARLKWVTEIVDLLVVNLYTPMYNNIFLNLLVVCTMLELYCTIIFGSWVVNRTMVVVAETNLHAALNASLLDFQALWYKNLSIVTFSKWSLVSSIVCVNVIIN